MAVSESRGAFKSLRLCRPEPLLDTGAKAGSALLRLGGGPFLVEGGGAEAARTPGHRLERVALIAEGRGFGGLFAPGAAVIGCDEVDVALHPIQLRRGPGDIPQGFLVADDEVAER